MIAEPVALESLERCANCRGELHLVRGELTYERAGLVVTVEDVPMWICDICGERYMPGPVGVKIGDVVAEYVQFAAERIATGEDIILPRSLVMQASERVALLVGR